MNLGALNKINNNGFHEVCTAKIAGIDVELTQYQHSSTGAEHIHLACDSNENAFLIALRTPPSDSTGIFHVLEHLITCGSEKYPINNLFFKMAQRSVNSFMNAFTSSDWTAFPFSSSNKKDFDNLRCVFLDAVFFSKLAPLDFAQEGWRLEFSERSKPDSDLIYNGVVLNEMKGAMNVESEVIWEKLVSHLYPGSCYQYNHGGLPEHITQLSHQQLKMAYRTYYHPENAILITFGDIEACEHQAVFDKQVLSRFSKKNEKIYISNCKRAQAPFTRSDLYPASPDTHQNSVKYFIAWLLGRSSRLDDILEAELLSRVLLTNSRSPLFAPLIESGLIDGPSETSGIDLEHSEISFICSFEQSSIDNLDKIESIILDQLEHLAVKGIPYEVLSCVVDELAIEKMDIDSDFMPNSVDLLFKVLPAAIHRTSPVEILDLANAIGKLRERIKTPTYIKHLIKKLLINNPHRLKLTLSPEQELRFHQHEKEKNHLEEIKAGLSFDEKLAIIEQSKALLHHQNKPQDHEMLPKLMLKDIVTETTKFNFEKIAGNVPTTVFEYPTNGLVYQKVVVELQAFMPDELKNLKLLSQLIIDLNQGTNKDIDTGLSLTKQFKSNMEGFVTASLSADQTCPVKVLFGLSAKNFSHDFVKSNELLSNILLNTCFDDIEKIKQLIAQTRFKLEHNLMYGGHMLAMSAACAGFSYIAALSHQWHGLEGIQSIRNLQRDIHQNKDCGKQLSIELNQLRQSLIESPMTLQVVSDGAIRDNIEEAVQRNWSSQPSSIVYHKESSPKFVRIREFWTTNTQVNFCAMAFPTVSYGHDDEAALSVLGYYLHNGYLDNALRVQGGAYGVGASQESSLAGFRFFTSYDPRIVKSIEHFYLSINWLLDDSHDDTQLEQAIIRTIAEQSKNSSSIATINEAYINELLGIDDEKKKSYREALLRVTLDDLKRVTRHYLKADKANIVVISDHSNHNVAEELGLRHISLQG